MFRSITTLLLCACTTGTSSVPSQTQTKKVSLTYRSWVVAAGTIGAFDPRTENSNDHRLFTITQVVQEFGNTFHYIGWIYESGDGTQWFQANPGTTFGVAGGVIVQAGASTDASQYLRQITKLDTAIFGLVKLAIAINGMGNVHSRGCFSKRWDGSFPA